MPFYDVLDYIGFSIYPTVGTLAGHDSMATMLAGWNQTVLSPAIVTPSTFGPSPTPRTWSFAQLSSAFNKSIMFGEVGALSLVGAGYNPWDSTRCSVRSCGWCAVVGRSLSIDCACIKACACVRRGVSCFFFAESCTYLHARFCNEQCNAT